MGPSNVLSDKDVNGSLKNLAGTGANKADVKNMEYHRQVLQSKMKEEKYGYTTNTTITTTTTTTTIATTTATIPTTADGAPLTTKTGLDTTTTTARPSLASSSSSSHQMFLHRTLAGRPADPNASGACSSTQQYISPSDNIMSPCTAKLNALKGRQAGKAKPKSLFAQASAKKFVGENVLGARNAAQDSSSTEPGDDDNQKTA